MGKLKADEDLRVSRHNTGDAAIYSAKVQLDGHWLIIARSVVARVGT